MDQLRLLFDSPLPWLLPEGSIQWGGSTSLALRAPAPFPPGGSEAVERTAAAAPLHAAGALGDRVEGSVAFGPLVTGGRDDTGGLVPSDVRLRLGYAATRRLPLAAWLTVKAPTGPDRGGASTDETDLGAGLSAGMTRGRVSLFGHAGLELLGNPLANGSQDDVAAYGAGVHLPAARRWALSAEVGGHAFSRFDNDRSRLAVGAGWRHGRDHGRALSAVVVFWHGLNDDSATWGVRAALAATRF